MPATPSTNYPWIDSRSYTTIAAAHAIAVTQGEGIIIASNIIIDTATTITVPITILKGGGFTKSGSGTLAISGHFEAGLYQVFSGFSAGDVTFSAGSVKEVYSQWWGAEPDGLTDSYLAIQSALDSVSSETTLLFPFSNANRGMNATTVYLLHGFYNVSDTIKIPTGVIFDANNAVITQTTAGKDVVNFIYSSGHGYYGTFQGGLRNVTLDGNNLAINCLKLDTVNWGVFANIVATRGQTGILGQEVQYSTFSQITTHGNSSDGFVLTYHPDRPLLTSIDNNISGLSTARNGRYGLVLHASRFNTITQIDAGRNLVADVVIGGTLYNAVKGLQVSNNHIYSLKCEHNRDDAPTSGYAVLVSYGNEGIGGVADNTITGFAVTRPDVGTTYDKYFKWLYNGGFNTIINDPYDYNTAIGDTLWENPSVAGDFSIFRAITYSGLIVNFGSHWQAAYINAAATDAAELPASGSTRYRYTYTSSGGGITASELSTDVTNTNAAVLTKKVTGNTTNTQLTIQDVAFDTPGLIALNLVKSTISNTSGASVAVNIAPTYNQSSGSGDNQVLYLGPKFTTVSTGHQYYDVLKEDGGSEAVRATLRSGIVHKNISTIASENTITPNAPISRITGNVTINWIIVPIPGAYNGTITFIPDDAFSLGTSGNIASAVTATVNKTITITYDHNTSKWYPSY